MLKQLWRKVFSNWQDSVVVVSVPLRLTDAQRLEVKALIASQLPADAIVVVLDGGVCAGMLR